MAFYWEVPVSGPDEARKILREHGLPVTPARVALLPALAGALQPLAPVDLSRSLAPHG